MRHLAPLVANLCIKINFFLLSIEFTNGLSKIYENHETKEIIFEEMEMLDVESGNNVIGKSKF